MTLATYLMKCKELMPPFVDYE